MSDKEDYTKKIQKNMDKYKDKISRIDHFLGNAKANGREALLSQRDSLKEKLTDGEKMLQKVQSSSEDGYEKIKESAAEVFEELQAAFHEFSNFLTMEQLYRTQDELIEFGNEKIEDVQELVKNNPLTILACAIGVGFLVGTLLTRSK